METYGIIGVDAKETGNKIGDGKKRLGVALKRQSNVKNLLKYMNEIKTLPEFEIILPYNDNSEA